MALAYEESVPVAYRTEFINKVVAISNRLGINPNWLMIVMRFETANTFSPTVKNKGAEAYGLIQFTNNGISGLGVTLAQLRAMTAVQQLDWVEKYLARYKGRMTDLYQVYLAVFSPAYIGRPDAQKVYVSPNSSYALNAALDVNKDNVITVGEIKQTIKRYIPVGFDSGSSIIPDSSFPIVAIIAGLIILFFILNRSQNG